MESKFDEDDEEDLNRMYKAMVKQRHERIQKEMALIVGKFRHRSKKYNDKVKRPPTPTEEELDTLEDEVQSKQANRSELSLVTFDSREVADKYQGLPLFRRILMHLFDPVAIHPQSNQMIVLMGVMTLCFLYNAWSIPLGFSFSLYREANPMTWLIMDLVFDLCYLADTLYFRPRLMFLDDSGLFETDRRKTTINYIRKGTFKKDAISLLPLDYIYYLGFGLDFRGSLALLRLPKLTRFYNMNAFFDRLDAVTPFPTFVRLARTVNIMLYLIHLAGCAYYAFSDWEGLGSTSYVYDGFGNAYLICFYVGLKCSISVGKNPQPIFDNPREILFMGCMWIMGVFIFAVLIGNVKDIIAQGTKNVDEFMFKFDQISQYMYRMNVPESTMVRVKEWCQHTWKTQKSFDELGILQFLPYKLRSDVALNVHYNTLKKVKLFFGCDIGLLKALALKLRPLLFLPGDYICKKGDVGKEMFIINSGQVQVVGGPDDSVVFVTLGTGVCFGEIALLGTEGMNRRTANVRAHGFASLYVLFKEDLQTALDDYPEDRDLLARKAQKAALEVVAKQNAEQAEAVAAAARRALREDVVIPLTKHPRLLKQVAKVVSKDIQSDQEWFRARVLDRIKSSVRSEIPYISKVKSEQRRILNRSRNTD